MRVRLIPTGQVELLGLGPCLSRLFPDHEFQTVPLRVDPDGRKVPFDSVRHADGRPSGGGAALTRFILPGLAHD